MNQKDGACCHSSSSVLFSKISVVCANGLFSPTLISTNSGKVAKVIITIVQYQSLIEGVKADERRAEIGYLEKMQQNLKNLKEGLECKW